MGTDFSLIFFSKNKIRTSNTFFLFVARTDVYLFSHMIVLLLWEQKFYMGHIDRTYTLEIKQLNICILISI